MNLEMGLGLGHSLHQTIDYMGVLCASPAQIEECVRLFIASGVPIEVVGGPPPRDYDDDSIARLPAPQTLHDHLRSQLHASRLAPGVLGAALLLVDCCDDDGLLTDTLQAIAAQWSCSEPLLGHALRVVQQLEPVGVGARDRRECLVLQLRDMPADGGVRDLALAMMQNLSWEQFVDCCRHQTDELRDVFHLLRSLDWRPGAAFTPAEPDVRPDVLVLRHNGRWCVQRNPAAMPRIRVREISTAGLPEEALACLHQAKRFANFVAQRNNRICEVADFMVARQHAFLEEGSASLAPLSRREIAAHLDVNESTISRTTAGRFAWTPRGLIAFSAFFAIDGVATDDGQRVAAAAVRQRIRTILSGNALSDGMIARRLNEDGIRISRECVGKYRRQMGLARASTG